MVGKAIEPLSEGSEREVTPHGTRFGEAGERIRSARIRSARSAAGSLRPGRSVRSRPDSGMSLTGSSEEVGSMAIFGDFYCIFWCLTQAGVRYSTKEYRIRLRSFPQGGGQGGRNEKLINTG